MFYIFSPTPADSFRSEGLPNISSTTSQHLVKNLPLLYDDIRSRSLTRRHGWQSSSRTRQWRFKWACGLISATKTTRNWLLSTFLRARCYMLQYSAAIKHFVFKKKTSGQLIELKKVQGSHLLLHKFIFNINIARCYNFFLSEWKKLRSLCHHFFIWAYWGYYMTN